MNNKTRKTLRAISIIIVLLVVFMQLGFLRIPIAEIQNNQVWLMVIAYAVIMISSRG